VVMRPATVLFNDLFVHFFMILVILNAVKNPGCQFFILNSSQAQSDKLDLSRFAFLSEAERWHRVAMTDRFNAGRAIPFRSRIGGSVMPCLRRLAHNIEGVKLGTNLQAGMQEKCISLSPFPSQPSVRACLERSRTGGLAKRDGGDGRRQAWKQPSGWDA
jgi:hypothetical protein